MSKTHKSPGNDNEPFLINQESVRDDKCSPRRGGHDWKEEFSNDTRNRVGVTCRRCGTSRLQDRTKEPNNANGEYPLAK
jgi:hypothetical protein